MAHPRTSPVWTTDRESLRKHVQESLSWSEVCRKIGIHPSSGRYGSLQTRIEEEGFDTSHFKGHAWNKIPTEEMLTTNSKFGNHRVKPRLIEGGLLEELCSRCGIGPVWNGEPLVLQLHHKNGVGDDNRIENLCLLCPNCHSQTENFSHKNVKR